MTHTINTNASYIVKERQTGMQEIYSQFKFFSRKKQKKTNRDYMCGGENNTPDDKVFSQGEIQTLELYENLLLKVEIQFYIQVKVEERVQDKNTCANRKWPSSQK